MLGFSEEFFKEEIRCDFTVPEEMKRAWAAEINLLFQIIQICKKHRIPYYPVWGTLLGTIRHQGFVPWDDDIDIGFKRQDYMRILPLLYQELPKEYCVYSIYRDKEHYQPTACVTNYSHLPLPQDVVEKNYGCPYIVGVDLYVLDYVPREEELAQTQFQLYNMVYDMAQRYDGIAEEGNTERFLIEIEKYCGVNIDRNGNIRNQLWLLCDRISSMFREEESDCLTLFQRRARGDYDFFLPKEWLESVTERPFENILLDVPDGYDGILKHMYGNYMEMRKGWSAHDYPFYKKQKEYLENTGVI